MYNRYLTETVDVSTKWWTGRVKEGDIAVLSELLEQRYNEGWDLVCYDYVMTYGQVTAQFLITYKRRDY